MAAVLQQQERVWRYVGETAQGETLRGELRARDEKSALLQVRQMGLRPVEIRPAALGRSFSLFRRTKLSWSELEVFTRGLADLLEAGIPLADALQLLQKSSTQRPLDALLKRLSTRILSGEGLASALAHDPAELPRLLVGLVRAGEESGNLGLVMREYADKVERENILRQELSGQLAYPVMLMGMILLTLGFLAWFVLPRFDSIFTDTAAPPPASTQFVLEAGAFVRTFGVWIPPAVILVIMLVKSVLEANGSAVGALIHRLPVLGRLSRQMLADKYFGAMGFLLRSGTPLARAEAIARDGLNSQVTRALLEPASIRVKAGTSLSEALDTTGLFEPESLQLAKLGEKNGELGEMLLRAAAQSQKAYSRLSKRLLEVVGPLMILGLGLVIGGVIVSVMVGILSLNEVVF